ncbi:MAG: VTT domain-containing protein [Acidobacteria bacterium]|nr:VTT domain-containing protein [Acidobacteriota bacterium]
MPSLLDFLKTVTDPWQLLRYLAGWPGYAILFAIVFAETGLLFGFFFPGDSLMFTIGVFAGAGKLDIFWVNVTLMTAAVLGDSFGYLLGLKTGPKIFTREDSRFFHKEHLVRTHQFYKKHGGKTIIYARFIPIIRTFAPFVAGVGQMEYKRFVAFNVFGGIGWVFSLSMLGYLLGEVPIVKKNFEKVILLIIFLSILPGIIEVVKHKLRGRRAEKEEAPVAAGQPK